MKNNKDLNIKAELENIDYEYLLAPNPVEFDSYTIEDVASGRALENREFKLSLNGKTFGVSRWVSPKRTRSYPFASVYNTGRFERKITIIPLVKDEGKDGDRDYLQWDTISLMSLLNVYVIIAWYDRAEKNQGYSNKITNQEFDYQYLVRKIKELETFQSDALHWNVKQVNNLTKVAKKAEDAYYQSITNGLGVKMHGRKFFQNKIEKIISTAELFKESSRSEAKSAQTREFLTTQPNEKIIFEKGTLTIKNWIGGVYYWTVDELMFEEKNLFLIEKKHSRGSLPSLSDIKDGLLKLVLYSNLTEAMSNGRIYTPISVLGLTAQNVNGLLTSWSTNNYSALENLVDRKKDIQIINRLFEEARKNGFYVFIANNNSIDENNQRKLLNSINNE